MPSFGDIIEAVDLLKIDPVNVDEDRCVAIRNRNSKCKKCADACMMNAIEVGRNKVTIDATLCVNCGCCQGVCPTDALSMTEPSRTQVTNRLLDVASKKSGMVVVACARKAAKNEADPERYAEVPCLAHLDEEQLVSLARKGFGDIVLVDGDCATCKLGAASLYIDAVVHNGATLLETADADAIITRASVFPPELLVDGGASLRGQSRRGLARQTGSYVRKIAENVATKTLDERILKKDAAAEKRRRRIASGGKLPTFVPAQNYEMIDDLTKIAETSASNVSSAPEGATTPKGIIATRHFGHVAIDASECSGCGMCVLFCPTQALKYDDFEEPEDSKMRYIEFSAADCTQCMLCKDVCLRNCLEVSEKVDIEEVCDPKPEFLLMPRPQARTSFSTFGRRDDRD